MYYTAYYADGSDTYNELPEHFTLSDAHYWASNDHMDGYNAMHSAPVRYTIYEDDDSVLYEGPPLQKV